MQTLQNGPIFRKALAATSTWTAVLPIIVLTLVVLSSLFYYKWGGAIRTVVSVQASGAYQARPELIASAGLPLVLASGARTINYLAIVWPALVFGVLIAGLVRAFVTPGGIAALFGSGTLRQQLVGGVAGMPLMLCSCCVTPVFSSVYASGARLGSSLALMLSSPSLNIAALLLTFLVFPRDMAFARTAMAALAVFVVPVLIEQLAGDTLYSRALRASASRTEEAVPRTLPGVFRNWAASSGYVAVRTLPLIALGVFVSGLLIDWFDHPSFSVAASGLVIAVVALLATLIALPTFFEIPLGLLLLASGFPPGAALAMLFAGPAINLPSLFTLARVSSKKVAVLVFLAVWVTATAGGLLLELLRP